MLKYGIGDAKVSSLLREVLLILSTYSCHISELKLLAAVRVSSMFRFIIFEDY